MIPALNSPNNKELLFVLYQRQAQQQSSEANILSQLMKMNLKANILKLIQDNSIHSDIEPLPSQARTLSSYMNQLTNANTQSSKLSNPQLANLLLYTQIIQRGQLPMNVASSENAMKSRTPVKREAAGTFLNSSHHRNVEPIIIPAFKGAQETSLQLHSPELFDKSIDGLNAKSKKIKKENGCGHPDRPHYAKNMCNQCYHKFGRTKKPWRCNHDKLYAHGLCQNCYINDYNKKRNQKLKEKKEDSSNLNSGCNESETDGPSSVVGNEEPLIVEDKAAFGIEENENTADENSQSNSISN